MKFKSRAARTAFLSAVFASALVVFTPICCTAGAENAHIATEALKAKMQGPEFKNVQVSVDPKGEATLSGTVPIYEYKVDAERRAQTTPGITAVRDKIQVSGSGISDAQIEKILGPEIADSRVGYGNLFDAILLHVQKGVVTLSGHAHDFADRDAAVGLASTTPGVKEVIDDIKVDPPSKEDWKIRMGVARAIYDDPALQKYALNPVRPIRISVQNARVELYGTVANPHDRQLAFTQAQKVPGVFSVKDYLNVAKQPIQKK